MICIIDEETGNNFTISKEALNAITDHRLRMPKPKDVEAYRIEDGKKIPNVDLTDSLKHVFTQCYFQMLENLKRELMATFDRYNDGQQNIKTLRCGSATIKRTVHIGFWKLLTQFTPKNPQLTFEEIANMDLTGSDNFEIRILQAEIKPRVQPVVPAVYSKAELERNNTREK